MTFIVPVVGGDRIRRTFISASLQDVSSSPKASFTFSSVSFGTAFPERRIVAALGIDWLGTVDIISSVTIGGVAATIIDQQENLSVGAGMAVAHVPSGASGDIIVALSGNAYALYGSFYSLSGLHHTTQAAKTVVAGAGGNIDIPSSGACIGMTTRGYGAIAWTGLTEDNEKHESTFLTYSTSSDEFVNGASNHAVSTSGGTAACFIAASWGP